MCVSKVSLLQNSCCCFHVCVQGELPYQDGSRCTLTLKSVVLHFVQLHALQVANVVGSMQMQK